MLLAVDVGNTNTKVGVFEGPRLRASWALATRRQQTADELGVLLEALLRGRGLRRADVTGLALSNVVPPLQPTLDEVAARYFAGPPLTVVPGRIPPLPLAVDDPGQVGADRVVAALAALERWGAPVIVVDLGTASRLDCVNAGGAFVGGTIAPGLAVAAEALWSRAARLPRVDLRRPERAIGRDAAAGMRAGIVLGYAGLVDGLVARARAELGGRAPVVATGGLAPLLAGVARAIDHVDADLKLHGLRLAWERARG